MALTPQFHVVHCSLCDDSIETVAAAILAYENYEARIYLRGAAGAEGEYYESPAFTDETSARQHIAINGKRANWELFGWDGDDEPDIIDSRMPAAN